MEVELFDFAELRLTECSLVLCFYSNMQYEYGGLIKAMLREVNLKLSVENWSEILEVFNEVVSLYETYKLA